MSQSTSEECAVESLHRRAGSYLAQSFVQMLVGAAAFPLAYFCFAHAEGKPALSVIGVLLLPIGAFSLTIGAYFAAKAAMLPDPNDKE